MIRPARQRGQATVELALGILLSVTVLLVGIYLAETSYLALKVSEAANYAAWYSTGLRAEQFDTTDTGGTGGNPNATSASSPSGSQIYAPFGSVAPKAQSDAAARYANFDGFDTTGGGTQQVFANASAMQVRCAVDTNIGFALNPANTPGNDGAYPGQVRNLMQRLYQDKGSVTCTASAKVGAPGLSTKYFQRNEGGTFHDDLWSGTAIPLCGVGRAQGGSCKGELAMLVGDWALDGAQGTPQNGNMRYKPFGGDNYNQPLNNMLEDLYVKDGLARGTAASTFATVMAGPGASNPYDETTFFNSYGGYERQYWDVTPWLHNSTSEGLSAPDQYVNMTAGVTVQGWNGPIRGNCFLGRNDPSPGRSSCTQPAPNANWW